MLMNAFFQAVGALTYISLVGFLIWNGDQWLGPVKSFIGPVVVLTVLVVSVLVVGLITLWKPAILFWEKKKRSEAVKLVAYTVMWLVLFILIAVGILMIT